MPPIHTEEFPRGHEGWARVLSSRESETHLVVRCRGYFPLGTERAAFYVPEPDESLAHWPLVVDDHAVDGDGVHTLVLRKSNNDTGLAFAGRRPDIVTSCGNLRPAARRVRADYDGDSIRVYQAFGDATADELASGRFGRSFLLDRMSWIKPSFLWMMARCQWSARAGMSRCFRITLPLEFWYAALEAAALSSAVTAEPARPNRVQWDPDRGVNGGRLERRAIQVGLRGRFLTDYVDAVEEVTEISEAVWELDRRRRAGEDILAELPFEFPMPTPDDLADRLGMRNR